MLGDEGIGVLAVKRLEASGWGARASLLDGGTGGFHLLGCFSDYARLIVIDAAMDGKPAGTVSMIRPRFATDFPTTLSAHDIGLKDLIESAFLLGATPELVLITISVAGLQPMTLEPSAEVMAALPAVESALRACFE